MQRHEVNQALLDLFVEPRYLEIGVDHGTTFHALRAARKVAVDPHFKFDVASRRVTVSPAECEYFEMTSDTYFSTIKSAAEKFDLVFIDGLHTFDQTLKDLLNAMASISDDGIIVVDDVIPSSYPASIADITKWMRFRTALPDTDGSWMGDVYRLVFFIQHYMTFFEYATVQENHGQLILWRSRRESNVQYPVQVEAISRLDYADALLDGPAFKIKPFNIIMSEIPPRPRP